MAGLTSSPSTTSCERTSSRLGARIRACERSAHPRQDALGARPRKPQREVRFGTLRGSHSIIGALHERRCRPRPGPRPGLQRQEHRPHGAGRDPRAGHPDGRQKRLRHAARDGGQVQRGDRPRRSVPDHRHRRGDHPRQRGERVLLSDAQRLRPQGRAGRRAAVPDLLSRGGRRARPRCRTSKYGDSSSSRPRRRASAASPPRPPSRSSSSASARPSARTSSTSTRTARARSSPASSAASSAATSSSTWAAPRRCCRCASRCRASRYRAGDRIVRPSCSTFDKASARARRSSCRARTRACSRSCSRWRSRRSTRRSCASRPSAREPGARSKIAVAHRATATSTRSAPASA